MGKTLGVGIIGHQFMGKAHSNAWHNVAQFFDLPAKPLKVVLCAVGDGVAEMADRWGWGEWTNDYKAMVQRDDIDIVDICTPNFIHKEMALAAAKAGKHILCEKPLAMTPADCVQMTKAVKKAKITNMISHCYRRIPAMTLAKEMIEEGKLGRIFHCRAEYLQDWIIDPNFPLVWRLKKEIAGSGAHGDLNAHIIDLARWLCGEFDEVCGMTETFIKRRPLEEATAGAGLGGGKKKNKKTKMGSVTVDDATLFLARFKNGAIGTFEATRFAQGRKNGWSIELNGEKGSLRFYFEDMNELMYLDATRPAQVQGWTRILVTEPEHPYMEAWWPAGHIIGYEHTFVNQAKDFVTAVAKKKKVKPDFEDGLRNQEVMEAVLKSARQRRWIKVPKAKV